MAKTRTTVTIDEDLLAEARSLPVPPLSNLFEESVRAAVKKAREQQWLEENREAIAEYNKRIEKEGTFSEKYGAWRDESV
ncbi:type II toxin-antitoxin system CcdA family antitoxin [Endozoicomonas sp. SCSIO W0465]|uniref:type II toxin-antitoxin system CcdA family antitoxin n=1 Tax=Endozoicomonas TaxID=305899 RepID=UPI002074FAFE|nr:type II toxin-antitoxin system CcdA family antitoxin [Endozoicomonas sp. SCSIO W0465]USE35884.1 type II toxin-antitoxin system CcdA family antitoxin [Endozoicomonas sp. SCSIO W0465]